MAVQYGRVCDEEAGAQCRSTGGHHATSAGRSGPAGPRASRTHQLLIFLLLIIILALMFMLRSAGSQADASRRRFDKLKSSTDQEKAYAQSVEDALLTAADGPLGEQRVRALLTYSATLSKATIAHKLEAWPEELATQMRGLIEDALDTSAAHDPTVAALRRGTRKVVVFDTPCGEGRWQAMAFAPAHVRLQAIAARLGDDDLCNFDGSCDPGETQWCDDCLDAVDDTDAAAVDGSTGVRFDYTGGDVRSAVLARARANTHNRTFKFRVFDPMVFPFAHAVDVVVHLTAPEVMFPAETAVVLQRVRESGSRFLVLADYTDGTNEPTAAMGAGGRFRPNFQMAPFSLRPLLSRVVRGKAATYARLRISIFDVSQLDHEALNGRVSQFYRVAHQAATKRGPAGPSVQVMSLEELLRAFVGDDDALANDFIDRMGPEAFEESHENEQDEDDDTWWLVGDRDMPEEVAKVGGGVQDEENPEVAGQQPKGFTAGDVDAGYDEQQASPSKQALPIRDSELNGQSSI